MTSTTPSFAGTDLLWEISGSQPARHRFNTRWFQDSNGNGPVFRVGLSEPERDWPRIHPGPLNAQTGYRELSASVEFEASGSAGRWHVLELDAQEGSGPCPDLRVEVNGHRSLVIPVAVREDRQHAPNPPTPVAGVIHRELRIPPNVIADDRNRIVITTVAVEQFEPLGRQQRPDVGSWFGSTLQWLRLALRREPAGAAAVPPTVTVAMTPLYQRHMDGELCEIVQVLVQGLSDLSATRVEAELAGVSADVKGGDADCEFGDLRLRFGVPEFSGPHTARVRVSAPELDIETTHECHPARKWTVHVLPHVHLDIGYTDAQAKVVELHSRNMDKALQILERAPDWEFSIDGTFIVQQYLRSRDDVRAERLMDALRSGRLSTNAMWALLLSGVAGLEDLYRSMYFAADLARRHGVPVTYANLTDVPSYSAAVPSVLSAAGIGAFLGIANHTRGGNVDSDELHLASPLRWRGPDGAEVLAFFADCYTQLRFVCADPPTIAGTAQGLTRFLERYERRDYLPDHIPLVGTHSDNEDLSHGYAGLADAWNAVYEWPRMQLSTFAHYLDAVRPLRDRLPELAGDGGSYWEDGVGTQAAATAVTRRAQSLLPAAEAVSALVTGWNDGLRPDIATLDEAWQCVLIGSEHTWTSAHATTHPHAHQSSDQLDWKVARIHRGHRLALDETRRALSQLAERIDTSNVPAVLVVNPTSWSRAATIEVELPADRIVVDESGAPLAADTGPDIDGLRRTRLRLPELPAFGYRLLPVSTADSPPTPLDDPAAPAAFDTPHYRVTLDGATGAIVQLEHRADGRRTLDESKGWALGDVLYASGGGSAQGRGVGAEVSSIHDYDPALPAADISIEAAALTRPTLRRTPWGHVVERVGSGPTMASIRQRIEFFDDSDRIELTVEIDKQPTLAKEAVYVAFPFDIDSPTLHYDRQQGWITPATDHQIGACNEWLTIQNAIVVDGGSHAIEWAAADAPLFTMSDVVRGTWARRYVDRDATVLSWVMNNYWWTNTPAQQGGPVRLRYAFRPARGFDPAAAGRFGRDLRSGVLVSDLLNTDRCDDEPRPWPMADTLWPLDVPANVIVSAFAGRTGAGVTVRAQEIGGQATQLRLPHPHPRDSAWAAAATATETEQARIPLDADDSITLSLRPYEVRTVLFGS